MQIFVDTQNADKDLGKKVEQLKEMHADVVKRASPQRRAPTGAPTNDIWKMWMYLSIPAVYRINQSTTQVTEIAVTMFALSIIFCLFCVRRIIYFSPLFWKSEKKQLLPHDSTKTAASTRERLSKNGVIGDTNRKMALTTFESIPAHISLRGIWENGLPSTQGAQREKGLKIGRLL